MGECEDRNCQKVLNETHQEVFGVSGKDGLKEKVKTLESNQVPRMTIVQSKVPKTWIWLFILLITPVTGIALLILISQATADVRFAEKGAVIKNEARICAVEKIIQDQKTAREEQTKKILDAIEELKP